MADPVWTQANIVKLKKAIASGTLQVRHGDEQVTFRSLSEMREILAMLEDEVDDTAGKTPVKAIRFQTSKGFC